VDRIVLVTGGGNGLGKAVAARFATDGGSVFITGRDGERLAATAAEIGARTITCDATDPRQVAGMATEVGDALDVLVNMAGGNTDFTRPPSRDADLDDVLAAWRANLDANLISAVLTTTAVLGKLRAGGTVINIGSIGAEYAATSYGAAKAALAAWTAGLSAEAGPRGLTANLISRLHRRDGLLPRQADRAAPRRADRGDPRRARRGAGRHRGNRLLPRLPRRPPHHRADPARQRGRPHHQVSSGQRSAIRWTMSW